MNQSSYDIFIRGIIYIVFVAITITIFELIFFLLFIVPQQTKEIHNFIIFISKMYKEYVIENLEDTIMTSSDTKLQREIEKEIKKRIYNDIYNSIENNTKIYIEVSIERERRLIDKNNNYAVIIIILEIIFLTVAMYCLYKYLRYITNIRRDVVQTYSSEGNNVQENNRELENRPIENIEENREENHRDIEMNSVIERTNSSITTIIDSETMVTDVYKNGTDLIPNLISACITIFILSFFQIFMYNFAHKYKYIGMNGYDEILYMIQNKLRNDLK